MKERLEITQPKYYTRTVKGRLGSGLIWLAMVLTTAWPATAGQPATDSLPPALAAITSRLELRVERIERADRPPIELRIWLNPGAGAQVERIIAISTRALTMLDAWFGPYPYPSLSVIDSGWRGESTGESSPGVVTAATRWLTLARDRALERSLVAGIARQYWQAVRPTEGGALQEGLAIYSGTRAIHETLEGNHIATLRFFGDFVPFPIRSLSLSPNPAEPRPRLRRFAEVDERAPAGGEARRAAIGLLTLERFLGWPALQQALSTFRDGLRQGRQPPALADVVSAQRGTDVSWLFSEAFSSQRRFDYGIGAVTTSASSDARLPFRTGVVFQRFGDAVFAGAALPPAGDPARLRSLPVLLRFADGSEAREWWDGRDAEWRVTYDSPAPAVLVAVDPERMLVLDDELSNNTRALQPGLFMTGIRLACHWALWLQDAMLSYAGLV
jgi:hypothetical protein